MAMTITCADMGYSCGFEIVGESMDQILSGVKHHSMTFHDYSEEELDTDDVIDMSSFDKAVEILGKYDVDFTA